MDEMPVLFETAWTDFPIPAHQVLADLQTFFPDKNFDTLNAKMAYLQVDRHAATLTEKITEQALKSLAKDTISTKMSEIYLQENKGRKTKDDMIILPHTIQPPKIQGQDEVKLKHAASTSTGKQSCVAVLDKSEKAVTSDDFVKHAALDALEFMLTQIRHCEAWKNEIRQELIRRRLATIDRGEMLKERREILRLINHSETYATLRFASVQAQTEDSKQAALEIMKQATENDKPNGLYVPAVGRAPKHSIELLAKFHSRSVEYIEASIIESRALQQEGDLEQEVILDDLKERLRLIKEKPMSAELISEAYTKRRKPINKHAAYVLNQGDINVIAALDRQSIPIQETLQGTSSSSNDRPEQPRHILQRNHFSDGCFTNATLQYMGSRGHITELGQKKWALLEHPTSGWRTLGRRPEHAELLRDQQIYKSATNTWIEVSWLYQMALSAWHSNDVPVEIKKEKAN